MEVKSGEDNILPKKLKPKHALFVKHYINTHNASEAVRLSGYKDKEPARTANNIMKRPEVIQEISRQEAELHKALTKDRPTFLLELRDLKARCKEKGKLDAEIKVTTLEAQILGLTKEENTNQTTNIFQSLDAVDAFKRSIQGKGGGKDNKPREDIATADIVPSSPILAPENGIHTQADDNTISPVIDI
jgi:hypothetical protein